MATKKFRLAIPVDNAAFRREDGEVDLDAVADQLLAVVAMLREGRFMRRFVDVNGNATEMTCEIREDF